MADEKKTEVKKIELLSQIPQKDRLKVKKPGEHSGAPDKVRVITRDGQKYDVTDDQSKPAAK